MMRETIGIVFMAAGIFFLFFGALGIYRYKNFYARSLVASKIDTVGFLTLLVGVMIHQGISMFSLKVLAILSLGMVINPLVSHYIVRSAYKSGYHVKKDR